MKGGSELLLPCESSCVMVLVISTSALACSGSAGPVEHSPGASCVLSKGRLGEDGFWVEGELALLPGPEAQQVGWL